MYQGLSEILALNEADTFTVFMLMEFKNLMKNEVQTNYKEGLGFQ